MFDNVKLGRIKPDPMSVSAKVDNEFTFYYTDKLVIGDVSGKDIEPIIRMAEIFERKAEAYRKLATDIEKHVAQSGTIDFVNEK